MDDPIYNEMPLDARVALELENLLKEGLVKIVTIEGKTGYVLTETRI